MSDSLCDDAALCYTYIGILHDIERLGIPGLNLGIIDDHRRQIHDKMCLTFGLTKEETLCVTSNCADMDGMELYDKLFEMGERKKRRDELFVKAC